jgi:hypothetical protein
MKVRIIAVVVPAPLTTTIAELGTFLARETAAAEIPAGPPRTAVQKHASSSGP